MKKSIFILLIVWLCQLSALAQTDGYNPPNPPDPTVPDQKPDEELFSLQLMVSPVVAGSVSSGNSSYAEGKSIYVYTNGNSGFVFQYWIDNEGTVVSRNSGFYYTMPKRNVVLTAVYKYQPANPADPTVPENVKTYKLTLTAKPVGAGSFSPSSGNEFKEGDQPTLYAYSTANFKFNHWEDADGRTVSTAQNFYYVMPAKDTQLFGVFDYVPANPANPGTNSWDSFMGEVIVDDFTPGSMSSAIYAVIGGSGNASKVTSIVAAGRMNTNDLQVVNNFQNCAILDLSRTTGLTTVPNYYYNNANALTQILLPSTVENIENYAFGRCSGLSALTCYAVTPPTIAANAFDGVAEGLVIYVPENSVALYEAADVWKNYVIMPIQKDSYSLEINLPDDCSDGRYKNMVMELINVKSGQKYRYVVTDRLNYTFYNLMKGTAYNAYLKNLSGDVLSEISGITVENNDQSLTFSGIKQLHTVSLKVLSPEGNDLTSQVEVRWFDSASTFLLKGQTLDGQVEGASVRFAVELPQTLGVQFVAPKDSLYEVLSGENAVSLTLAPLPQMKLCGKVVDDETGEPLDGVTVTVTQTLNGKFSKAFAGKTDRQGSFSLDVIAAPSTVTFAAQEYINKSVAVADSLLCEPQITLDEARLVTINGTTVSLGFTYTTSVAPGETAQVQDWYADYNNVAYTIYNKTQQRAVKEFSVQYPKIVMLEKSAEGDVLQITVASKTGAFKPVTIETTVDAYDKAKATFPIVQLGGIKAVFTQTENSSVLAMLYDAAGTLVKTADYDAACAMFSDVADGDYTLVSMGESSLFNSVYNLAGLVEAGLREGTDYVKNAVKVESGVVATVKNAIVPFFDDTKLYYTGEKTSFTVNKSSVVAGNYLTMQAKVDFKEAYRSNVSNVELVFELPEGCSLVENSLMVGTKISGYSYEQNTVTVQLGNLTGERVRFCVIPTQSGEFAPNASVKFMLGGKSLTQPIGSTSYKVEDLEIRVPSTVCKPEFSVSGVATGNSTVEIYSGSDLIGQTKSLANGMWTAKCQLYDVCNLGRYQIFAKVTTKNGLEMQTENQTLVYDENAIEISKVHMYHWNPELNKNYEIVFDYQNPSTVAQKYTYYIYNRQFTFTIDFTENDTTKVKDVMLRVKTGDGKWTVLPTSFDVKKNCWVASGEFGNMYDGIVPKNVGVAYRMVTPYVLDAKSIDENLKLVGDVQDKMRADLEESASLVEELLNLYLADSPDEAKIQELENKVYSTFGLTETEPAIVGSEEDGNVLINSFNEQLADTSYSAAQNILEAKLSELSKIADYAKGMEFGTSEGYDEATILDNGFEKVVLNDSSVVYFKYEETKVTLVSFKNNYSAVVELDENSPAAQMMRVAGKDDFVAKANAFIDYVQERCGVLNDGLGRVQNFLDTYQNLLGVAYKKSKEVFSKNLATLKMLAKNRWAGRTFPGQKIIENGLKETARKSGNVMHGTQKVGKALGGPVALAAKKVFAAFDIVNQLLAGVRDMKSLVKLYQLVPKECPLNQSEADNIRNKASALGLGAISFYSLNIAADVIAIKSAIAAGLALAPSGGTSVTVLLADLGLLVAKAWACSKYEDTMKANMSDLRNRLRMLRCKKGDKGYVLEDDYDWHDSTEPDNDVSIDPSGFVYEGVQTNRLEGVIATAYYKEIVEDQYGDLHENIVLWNAEEYSQQNPLFTDENGMYRWDVPQGLWQVKFEKEGYQTTCSEWLPVPPPQMDVNIGMVQNVQPEVVSAKAYEDGVEIEFSKYMKPESLSSDNVYLKLKTGVSEELLKDITVAMLNEEAVEEGSSEKYVSKVKLDPGEKDITLADEVYVVVSNRVQSYAGIQMADAYSQKLDVEKKMRKIQVDETINIGYGQSQNILIGVLPADAAKGKTLYVNSASDMIATVSGGNAVADESGRLTLVLDENGQTSITVNGELLGTTALQISAKGIDLTAQSLVNVVDPAKLATVKDVVASRISGTAVYRGQTVTLSCETDGAVIYYTIDGSCPCDVSKRIKYDGKPIAINGDMTLKVMAVGMNGSESETKEFAYTIKQTNMRLALASGWNWASHNQADDIAANDLKLSSIKRIQTQTDEMFNDPNYGFVGYIDDVNGGQTIKVETSAATDIVLHGEQYNPTATAVMLHRGWNWIGYPMDQIMSIGEAMQYLDAEEGDFLTNLSDGYAQYHDGSWIGDLEVMTPGQGYLFKSVSEKSFVYNDAIVSNAKSVYGHRMNLHVAPWAVSAHRYPSMMCITAELYADGVKQEAEDYCVGAFVDGECRGVGKVVNGVVYLSVYGDKLASVTFRAFDRNTGDILDLKEEVEFCADVLGAVSAPFKFHFGETTGISDVQTDRLKTGKMFNINGQLVRSAGQQGIYIYDGKKVSVK